MLFDGEVDAVAGEALVAKHGLIHVVRQLALVEVRPAALAAPDDLVLIRVLHGEAVGRHVVAVDDEAVFYIRPERGGTARPAQLDDMVAPRQFARPGAAARRAPAPRGRRASARCCRG